MKKILNLLFLVVCTMPILSCSKDDGGTDPEAISVTLNPDSYTAPAAATTFRIQVTTNAKEWTAYVVETAKEWMSIVVNNNGSDSYITVTLKANAGEERSGVVTFKSGQTRKEVKVVQNAPLSVEPKSVFLPKEGGNKSVTVNYKGNWDATTEDAWIICKKSGNELTLNVAQNDGNYRTGKVTVKGGEESVEVEVKQDGNEEIVCPIEGYHLVWNDEFSQEGIDLDAKNWTHEVKPAGWVNNEKQTYVNTKSPKGERVTEVKEGTLRIHCFKEDSKIYSGRVYGCVSSGWQYGYVEAKIKLPSGKGTWPAFWMMPVNFTAWPDDGEIDIMEEVGYRPDYVSSSLHATGHVHSKGTQVTKETYCKGAEGEFHVYGMEWTADYFQFYVDGKKTLYYKNPGTGKVDWPYDAPFYVILNLAWGGDWGGSQGVDESKLPVTMEVDYVRVFQK